MKSPLLFGIFFLVVSLKTSLVAMPGGTEKQRVDKNHYSSPDLTTKGRRLSEQEGNSSSEQRGTTVHIKDWDDLLNSSSENSGSSVAADDGKMERANQFVIKDSFQEEREEILKALAEATRKAYQQGDEQHPDWKEVSELIEELAPNFGPGYSSERLSPGGPSEKAEAVELQYYFFQTTLPALKKTSVVAALRGFSNFQTAAAISDKAQEANKAWSQALSRFERICKENRLNPDMEFDVLRDQDADDFDESSPFKDCIERLSYNTQRANIESSLDDLHHNIIQNLIKANVFGEDFEKKAFDADTIRAKYQPFLSQIKQAKEKAVPVIQDKWENFSQEAAVRCLEDIAQVNKIQSWKEKNELTPLIKNVEQMTWVAKNTSARGKDIVWKNVTMQNQAVLRAWEERKTSLETFLTNLGEQKANLGLAIVTPTEKEMQRAVTEAKQAIENVNKLLLTVPLHAAMDHATNLHRMASNAYEIEKRLRSDDNRQSNKEKYLALASTEYQKIMKLIQELQQNVAEALDADLNQKIERFKQEFKGTRLFLVIAPSIKSQKHLELVTTHTANIKKYQEEQDANETVQLAEDTDD